MILIQSIGGIDVSKDTLDVVLLKEAPIGYAIFSNHKAGYSGLMRWLVSRKAGQAHVCLEATGQYGDEVAETLYKAGYQVSVVNPARIKHYGNSKLHRNKTDKADAALIAEFCQRENPPLWKPLSPEVKHLRALIRRLDDLQSAYQQERNRSLCGEKDAWVLDDLQMHLGYLQERIRVARQAIQQHIE